MCHSVFIGQKHRLCTERETNTYIIHSFDYLLKLSGASHQATAAALMRQIKQTPPVSEKVR